MIQGFDTSCIIINSVCYNQWVKVSYLFEGTEVGCQTFARKAFGLRFCSHKNYMCFLSCCAICCLWDVFQLI
jgi:hypothetical protein